MAKVLFSCNLNRYGAQTHYFTHTVNVVMFLKGITHITKIEIQFVSLFLCYNTQIGIKQTENKLLNRFNAGSICPAALKLNVSQITVCTSRIPGNDLSEIDT